MEIFKDFVNFYLEELATDFFNNNLYKIGYTGDIFSELEKSVVHYMSLYNKLRFVNKKWIVKESVDLKCPNHLIDGYNNFKESLRNGVGIEKHMSKGIFKGKFDDMYAHWGILHFHLGNKLDNSNFIKRTKELAFVVFYNDIAFIAHIGIHGDWLKREIVEIMDKEFPESLSNGYLIGYKDDVYSNRLNDDLLKKLRNARINTPIVLSNGKVILNINGGVSSYGNNMIDSQSYLNVAHCLQKMKTFVAENFSFKSGFKFIFYDIMLKNTNKGYLITGISFIDFLNSKILICTSEKIYQQDF